MHSGKFVIRLGPSLHSRLVKKARDEKVSLNRLCARTLEEGISGVTPASGEWQGTVTALRKKFGDSLLGVVLFGSVARGEATESSDIDLLIVVASDVPITRALYRWWDEAIAGQVESNVNPHFIRLPESPGEAGGLWLEVAVASTVLWEREGQVHATLAKLREVIAAGHLRRRLTGGVPYWVRDEK